VGRPGSGATRGDRPRSRTGFCASSNPIALKLMIDSSILD
jgi:hypothetical protein